MSFLRFDVTTNDWVLFAPERARRPREFKSASSTVESEGACPFCPGNEYLAGKEIFALRNGSAPNTSGWTVRVVPNKFPALRIENDCQRIESGPFFRTMGGCGAHEVIIESPQHNGFLGHESREQVQCVLQTLQLRFNDLLRDARFQTIVIFKNHGEEAGTSLGHPHWQLIATPVVPRLLRITHRVATDYFDRTGDCLYCVLLREERKAAERLIAENDHFCAFVPYAAHSPFETWILPKTHRSCFGAAEPGHLRSLAAILKSALAKFHAGLNNPAFNLTINTAPRGEEERCFHWHMKITPRLSKQAGFESGSGMAINTVLPEDAAKLLKNVAT